MTSTHTPAAQPAGEMDDAALIEAMVQAIDNMPLGTERHEAISRALAIARPVIQDQARRKALDDAAEAVQDVPLNPVFELPNGFVTRVCAYASNAVLALKDKPNG